MPAAGARLHSGSRSSRAPLAWAYSPARSLNPGLRRCCTPQGRVQHEPAACEPKQSMRPRCVPAYAQETTNKRRPTTATVQVTLTDPLRPNPTARQTHRLATTNPGGEPTASGRAAQAERARLAASRAQPAGDRTAGHCWRCTSPVTDFGCRVGSSPGHESSCIRIAGI